MKRSIISRVVAGIITVIVVLILNWLFLPAWTFSSGNFWIFLIVALSVGTVAFGIVEYMLDEDIYIVTAILGAITVLAVFSSLVAGCFSWQCFHAYSYRNLVTIEDGNFANDITEESMQLIVDVDTAKKLGNRVVGSIENASWYEVDEEWNLCEIDGEYYRISPLNYSGLFKYNKANDVGIPGYVRVNATNQEAEFIQLENPIRYSPSGYFSKDLTRHLRSQYSSYMFGKSFFEVDDEGTAYYVTSVYDSTIGTFGGKKITSVIITDANSGKSEEYTLENVPEWVDHVYSISYLAELAYYHYEYVEGFINLSDTGIYRTTYFYSSEDENFAGYNSTITKDGIVFFTGLTPANSTESNIGFLTLNPRTGAIKYYPCSGAEESSAQAAAEGLVQNMQYTASFPTMVNIQGEETYFMLLKDKQGLIQRYALCNVENYSIVVQADSIEEAQRLYEIKLNGGNVDNYSYLENSIEDSTQYHEVDIEKKGTIENLYIVQMDGDTYYFFNLKNDTNLYCSCIKNNYNQVKMKKGTEVEFGCYEVSENVFEITEITIEID